MRVSPCDPKVSRQKLSASKYILPHDGVEKVIVYVLQRHWDDHANHNLFRQQ